MPSLGRLVQGRRHGADHLHRQPQVGQTIAGQVLPQILARDVLLGDVVHALHAAHLVDLHDVGVHQGGGRLGLGVESLDVFVVVRQALAQDLEGHLAAERKLFGQIDFGHAAAAQSPQNAIIAQLAGPRDRPRCVAVAEVAAGSAITGRVGRAGGSHLYTSMKAPGRLGNHRK